MASPPPRIRAKKIMAPSDALNAAAIPMIAPTKATKTRPSRNIVFESDENETQQEHRQAHTDRQPPVGRITSARHDVTSSSRARTGFASPGVHTCNLSR